MAVDNNQYICDTFSGLAGGNIPANLSKSRKPKTMYKILIVAFVLCCVGNISVLAFEVDFDGRVNKVDDFKELVDETKIKETMVPPSSEGCLSMEFSVQTAPGEWRVVKPKEEGGRSHLSIQPGGLFNGNYGVRIVLVHGAYGLRMKCTHGRNLTKRPRGIIITM